jgi:hypothetical protein
MLAMDKNRKNKCTQITYISLLVANIIILRAYIINKMTKCMVTRRPAINRQESLQDKTELIVG